MMMDKRLIGLVPKSQSYIMKNVLVQWVSLLANIIMMYVLTDYLMDLYNQSADGAQLLLTVGIMGMALCVRAVCSVLSSRMSYLSSHAVKQTLREKIYAKLLKLGSAYHEQVQTSEVVQVAVEGVDQLETYFGAYLPQFFYAMLAPLTLFAVVSFVNLPSALVLFICVPLIPVSIALVQTWAKKLLSKYWGQYTALGDTFLENLQGLTALKIYQSDAHQHKKMNEESERFRKITMKVLTMQLNSITIMDLIAYGGAALGAILAVSQFQSGNLNAAGALFIILLSADFFLPMRLLGSFFHIAMNGMAASDKIFRLLNLEETSMGKYPMPASADLILDHVSFAYDAERDILRDVSLKIPSGSFVSIAGESGCGKSTLASLIMQRNTDYQGKIFIGEHELRDIMQNSLNQNIAYISHQSYLFKGSVRENLLMGNPQADDAMLWEVLDRVQLSAFLKQENGLDTILQERGSNLSGGQRQRLALARGLLHQSQIYIFDEAASNIDVESENMIMREIHALKHTCTVILISHRLANVMDSDQIYVMEQGMVKESGTHAQLLDKQGVYEKLWTAQQSLEQYGKAGGSE